MNQVNTYNGGGTPDFTQNQLSSTQPINQNFSTMTANQGMAIQQSVPVPVQPDIKPPISMSDGGTTGDSIKDFFKNVNWLDVGILMLGTAALYYTIYYYRIKIKAQKKELLDVCNRMEMVEAKVNAIQKNQQSQNGRNKRVIL